jgi:hypothetical protein
MDEDSFEEVLRDLPRSYNAPPEPPFDEMWTAIEDAHFNAPIPITRTRPFAARTTWLAAAAALVIGIGIGRYVPANSGPATTTPALASAASAPIAETSAVADAYRDQTNHYLGQAAALLISLPAQDANPKTDSAFAVKASDLLVTTRLLIDSPAAAQDVKLHSLLEDLELVLVQIARLQGDQHKGDLDLIHQAVEQGDVISRLNSAVATTQSSE